MPSKSVRGGTRTYAARPPLRSTNCRTANVFPDPIGPHTILAAVALAVSNHSIARHRSTPLETGRGHAVKAECERRIEPRERLPWDNTIVTSEHSLERAPYETRTDCAPSHVET
jgi:hypothetical protein